MLIHRFGIEITFFWLIRLIHFHYKVIRVIFGKVYSNSFLFLSTPTFQFLGKLIQIISYLSFCPKQNHGLILRFIFHVLYVYIVVRIWDVRPFAPQERCVKVMQGHQHTFEKVSYFFLHCPIFDMSCIKVKGNLYKLFLVSPDLAG